MRSSRSLQGTATPLVLVVLIIQEGSPGGLGKGLQHCQVSVPPRTCGSPRQAEHCKGLPTQHREPCPGSQELVFIRGKAEMRDFSASWTWGLHAQPGPAAGLTVHSVDSSSDSSPSRALAAIRPQLTSGF